MEIRVPIKAVHIKNRSEEDLPSRESRLSVVYSEGSKSNVPIRVSSKNKIIRKRMSFVESIIPEEEEKIITTSCIERIEQEKFNEKKKSPTKVLAKLTDSVSIYSCFLIYILGKNGFRTGIAETELKNFRGIFNNMLQKSTNCHEAYFGLGKLNAYIGAYPEAIKNLKKAQSLSPTEKLYEVWLVVISCQKEIQSHIELAKQREDLKSNK